MSNDLFSISVLAEATGVNTITLRAWERRYGLLKPQRTAKGHRLYCAADVEHVNRVLEYIGQGVSVGKVAALLKLRKGEKSAGNTDAESAWQDYMEGFLAAAKIFNIDKLDSIFNEIISLYPIDIISVRLLLPLLRTYQARILAKYQGAIAEEHFLMTFIRNRLAAHFQQLTHTTHGQPLLFTSLESERHDFYPLLFGIHCMNLGLRVISLGTNTPLAQAIYAAEKIPSQMIVAFGTPTKQDQQAAVNSKTHIGLMHTQHKSADEFILLPDQFSEAVKVIRRTIRTTEGEQNG